MHVLSTTTPLLAPLSPSRSNFPSLAQRLRLFAVDWLGTGLSGRPAFRAKGREDAEDFFINSLVTWRRAAGLEGSKMILVSGWEIEGGCNPLGAEVFCRHATCPPPSSQPP